MTTNKWMMAALICAACGGGSTSAPDAASAVDSAPAIDAAPAASCADPAGLPVFLNRGGGAYTAGSEDPGANKSSILQGPVTLLPYTIDDPTWNGIVACVQKLVAPFHLRVTDQDPGAVGQVEIVITGASSMAVIGTAGVPEVSPFNCAPLRNAVHFVFPTELTAPPKAAVICQMAAQAIGHAGGLEFTNQCSDVMAFNVGASTCPGAGGFSDAALTCGTTSAMACMCGGGTTQNSFAAMTAAFGACP
jgi:hypothetical protein